VTHKEKQKPLGPAAAAQEEGAMAGVVVSGGHNLSPCSDATASCHGQGWECILSALPWITPGPEALEQYLQVVPPPCPKSIIKNLIRPFSMSLSGCQGEK